MHGSFDRSGPAGNRTWGIGLYALSAVLAMALIGLLISHPAVSGWVSQAAEAEFVGTNMVPDIAPTQLAKPAMETRTVRAN